MAQHDGLSPGWTVVLAYYNEADYLPATLASLAAQQLRPQAIILVDNGSRDASPAQAAAFAAAHPQLHVQLLHEARPGQVHALRLGLARVATSHVAICDADTVYPPDYLARATAALAAAPGSIAAFAHDSAGAPHSWREWLPRQLRDLLLIRLARGQTHAGGYAHCLDTAALRAAGSYDPARWPFVLKDHELVHRLAAQGRFAPAPGLWCTPSPRRADRSGVRWTLVERLLYHATPFAMKDWFFYRFLAGRFARRGLRDTVLRQRGWAAVPAE